MQNFNPAIAIAIVWASAATNVVAEESKVTTKLLLGGQTIDDSHWEAQDEHSLVGILTDIDTGYNGIRVAIDLLASGSEENTSGELKATYTAAAQLGIRKYCDLNARFKPYVGGGLNFAYAAQETNDGSGKTEQEDGDIGYWLNAGVDFMLTDDLSLGLDVRYAAAEVELLDESVDLDATSAGLSLGYRW